MKTPVILLSLHPITTLFWQGSFGVLGVRVRKYDADATFRSSILAAARVRRRRRVPKDCASVRLVDLDDCNFITYAEALADLREGDCKEDRKTRGLRLAFGVDAVLKSDRISKATLAKDLIVMPRNSQELPKQICQSFLDNLDPFHRRARQDSQHVASVAT
jgi:hypothetical protein